jgi:hypothetical protein
MTFFGARDKPTLISYPTYADWLPCCSVTARAAGKLCAPARKSDRDLRLELRDRASESGESMLKLSPRLSAFWRRFAERTALGP